MALRRIGDDAAAIRSRHYVSQPSIDDGLPERSERLWIPMPRTRVFESGTSQDIQTIFPARNSLKQAAATLRSIPKPPFVEKREPIEVPERCE
jgi:hypothetical protein